MISSGKVFSKEDSEKLQKNKGNSSYCKNKLKETEEAIKVASREDTEKSRKTKESNRLESQCASKRLKEGREVIKSGKVASKQDVEKLKRSNDLVALSRHIKTQKNQRKVPSFKVNGDFLLER